MGTDDLDVYPKSQVASKRAGWQEDERSGMFIEQAKQAAQSERSSGWWSEWNQDQENSNMMSID